MHEYAFGLTSTPKAEIFYSSKRRKFIVQNKVKISKLQSQNFTFLAQKLVAIIIRHQQLQWAHHVCRIEDDRLPKQVLHSKIPNAPRPIGRLKLTFTVVLLRSRCTKNVYLTGNSGNLLSTQGNTVYCPTIVPMGTWQSRSSSSFWTYNKPLNESNCIDRKMSLVDTY